ncbi:MAG: MutS-related protein [Acidimicrobiales bacterium]
MKPFLLYPDQSFDFDAELPLGHDSLVDDLELTVVFDAMAQRDQFLFEVSKKVLLTTVTDLGVIRYRQEVLADCVAEREIIKEIYAIALGALEDRRTLWTYSSKRPSSILAGALTQLEAAVVRLRELRRIADDHLDKFGSKGLRGLLCNLQDELNDEYFETIDYHLKNLRFRDGIPLSAELGPDNIGTNFVLRRVENAKSSWKGWLHRGKRSSYSFTIPPRDEAGDRALADLTSRGINQVANAAAQSAEHIISYFTSLRAELGFYLSCINLRDELTAKGQLVSFPEQCSWQPATLFTAGLRDVSLALLAKGPVVGNDVDARGKSLLIVTGANSGGKSTFLRSVGLAQLMMQCGMFVTAQTYRASVCDRVFTHFIREEDPSMNHGRLDEELSRMSAIVERITPHCLMLFNESFAATNEREGSEIGRQVVRALLDADIKVLFVTHQFDFAASFLNPRRESTLFLRAQRELDGQRRYQLVVADPLPTSSGKDLYYELGGWMGKDEHPRVPTSLVDSLEADRRSTKC